MTSADQNQNNGKKMDRIDQFEEDIKRKTLEIYHYLRTFLPNPFEGIKTPPNWSWQTLIFTQALIAVLSGALAGVVSFSVFGFLSGMILMPIVSLAMASISSLFFYYVFQIVFHKTVEFKKLFTVVVLANIPFFIFQIVSGYFKPISLVGLAITALLLVVGFVENFQLPRPKVTKMMAILYGVIFLVWLLERLDALLLERQF